MKKAKTLEVKLRSALRLIWSRSSERRQIIKEATCDCAVLGYKHFHCPICKQSWPIQMAEVDHIEPIGTLVSWKDASAFLERLFFSPQRAICKLCHKIKTKEDMRVIRAKYKVS